MLVNIHFHHPFHASCGLDLNKSMSLLASVVSVQALETGVCIRYEILVIRGRNCQGLVVDAVEGSHDAIVDERHFCRDFGILIILCSISRELKYQERQNTYCTGLELWGLNQNERTFRKERLGGRHGANRKLTEGEILLN